MSTLNPDQLRSLIRELSGGLHAVIHSGDGELKRRDSKTRGQTNQQSDVENALVLGLAIHTTQTAAAVAELSENEVYHAAMMPLVRHAYECGLRAQWLKHVPDAAPGFLNEHSKVMSVLAEELDQSASFSEYADEIRQINVRPLLETTSSGQAASMREACANFKGEANEKYLYYRLLSKFSHPSLYVAEQYVESIATDPMSLTPLWEPKLGDIRGWLYLAASATVWAQRALDYGMKGSPSRTRLRTAAKELGVILDFEPSEAAIARRFAPTSTVTKLGRVNLDEPTKAIAGQLRAKLPPEQLEELVKQLS